ncbi:MAG: AAA family ATPase [Sporichthyaceae bacterium]
MRPHFLEVTAFGAFAETVRVDFDDLAAGGLFLLHGETGAGKTTLLDALGFALYGSVPGARWSARRLRSDHAAAAASTSVCLEATVGGQRLRITRSPEQERAKKRGAGTTREQASVLLERWDGATWETLSTRVGEADAEIADRVGMTAEQFFQVVLLPQGEFARFLRADSKDRAELLKKLFGTQRFADVERWLADRRQRTAGEVERHLVEVARVTALIAQLAEIEGPPEVPDAVWASDLLAQHEAGVATAQRVLEAAAPAPATARSTAEATRALAARQTRRHAAEAARRELAEATGAIEALGVVADAAARAAEVAPVLRTAVDAAAALGTARRLAQEAVERSAALWTAAATPDALRQVAKDRARHRGGLEKLQSLAAEADAEDLSADGAAAAADAARAAGVAAGALLERLTPQRDRLLAERDAAVAAAEALPVAARLAELLAAAADVGPALDRAERACTDLTARHQAARHLEQERREEHLTLREARIDAMRVELAALLQEDAPCPVCGSLDHPDVPRMSAERVGMEREDAAAAALAEARAATAGLGSELTAAQLACADLRSRWELVLADLAEFELEPDCVGTAAAARQAKASAGELKKAAAARSGTDTALTALEAELASAVQAATRAEADAAAHDRESGAARARATARRAEFVAQLGDCPDLATAVDRAGRIAEAAEAAAEALEAVERAQAAVVSADAAAVHAATAAGFADVAEALAAARDGAWRADAADRIAAHRHALAGNAAVLADPELDVVLVPSADVPAAEAAERAAAAAHDAAVRAQTHAVRAVEGLTRTVPRLDALLAELPELARRAETARSLADLTAGQGANVKRMTLSSFVLAARLEEIAEVAGRRLAKMSHGRYTLTHTDSGRDARKKAGLGLLVLDNWTGKTRDTATLSGGETFLASLALALALADVVCAESGGTHLDSLFVDEGFGTLDPDTLDEVMDVLDDLRDGGRVVGIVSHVAELKQRIPNQLHVVKREIGSVLNVVA